MKKILIIIITMLLPLMDCAQSVTINGQNYYLNSSTNTAVFGQGYYFGDVNILPQVTYNGVTYTVTSIGGQVFKSGSRVTSVTLPNTITTIGMYAFWGLGDNTSIYIPNSVKAIPDECAFYCDKVLIHITDLEAWCSILFHPAAFYGERAPTYHRLFLNGNEIKNLVIPNSVSSISSFAFSCCTSFTSVTIPNSVTSIGDGVFRNCSNLTSVTIPNSVKSIGWEAFYGCDKLSSVTIPNSVTSIGLNAFQNCSSLTSITIPNSVTSIGSQAFYGTGWYNNQPDGLVYAGKVAYKYKGTMPNNSSIKIQDGTIGISQGAFSGCSGLTSVTIPNSVTAIGSSAFQGCTGLTSITIPNSVTAIGSSAFQGCSGLTSITIPNSVTSISSSAFSGTGWYNNQPNGLVYAGKFAYNYKGTMPDNTSITIKEGTLGIADYAFSGCRGLTSITIPNSVTSIGSYAFYYCYNLQFICLKSEAFPSISASGNNTACQYIMPQTAFDGGIPTDITNYATYGVTPMYIKVKSTTATSATLELTPIDIVSGKTNETTTYEAKVYNLEPGAAVKGSWEIEGKDRGVVSIPNVKTQNLVMTIQPAQALSTTKAKLSATVDEPNDDKHYGFEWRRIGVDDLVPSNVVYSQLYDGHIVGTLSNLNPDISYKYRPFYKSDSGETFYGEWIGFLTGDANVFFEPEVHTNEPVALTENGAQLSGVWVEGTEDIQEKGFEYWPKNSGARPTRAGNVTAIIVKGNNTSVTLEGLEAGTEYVYRSYLRTASGTVYGEEKTFKTPLLGDANDDGKVNVADVVEVVNAKAGKASASFNMTNADVDGNGNITEAEIVKVIMQK